MNLFIVKDGDIALDKDEILLYDEFRVIYRRDKTKFKIVAFKEFNYIYQVSDFKAHAVTEGMAAKEAHKYATEIAKLEKGWTPDEKIKQAIRVYKEVRHGMLIDSYTNLTKVFRSINHSIESMHTQLINIIDSLNRVGDESIIKFTTNADEERILDDVAILSTVEKIDSYIELANVKIDKLMDKAKKVPDLIKTIKSAETAAKDESMAAIIARGGDAVSMSQQPGK